MSDRFDAQLREHLLGTADAKPADGQLAAVVDAVARTGQRPSIAARLTWFPGRIGPVPTRTLRYGLVALALIAATIAAALYIGNTRTRSTVFEGTWVSIDSLDRSEQRLIVGPGLTPEIRFIDNYASGPACYDDAVKVFTADGRGNVVGGDRLESTWPSGGGCGLVTVEIDLGYFDYHQATDSLVDNQSLTWNRAADTTVLPTPDPVTDPTPTGPPPTSGPEPIVEAPGSEACVDVPAGWSYHDVVGPLSLTATIPSNAEITWQGSGAGTLSLTDFCPVLFANAGPSIGASIVTYVDGSCEVGDAVEVTTAAEAVAALADIRGVAISEPSNVTLAGRNVTRFEIGPEARMCFDTVPLWNGFDLRRGLTVIYVVDVDGLPLAVTFTSVPEPDQAPVRAEPEAIIASLEIDAIPGATPSRAPVPTPDPGCVQLDGAGAYTARVGTMSVSATVPANPGTSWSGSREWFRLLRSPCGFDAPLTFEAQLITKVAVDACRGFGDSVVVSSAAEAATALIDQAATDATGRTDLTIDGKPAVRVLMTQPDLETSACDEGAALLLGQTGEDSFIRIDPGYSYWVHLIDVDGGILAITAEHESGDGAEDPTIAEDIDGIIGALRIGS